MKHESKLMSIINNSFKGFLKCAIFTKYTETFLSLSIYSTSFQSSMCNI